MYLKVVFIFMVFTGVCGILYVSNNNIESVYRQEGDLIKFVSNLDADATIVSSQDNQTLVEIYGDKNYVKIDMGENVQRDEFYRSIVKAVDENKNNAQADEIIKEINIFKNGQIVKNDRVIISDQNSKICEDYYHEGDSVYFLYSYRKAEGLNTSREYLNKIMDINNINLYDKLGYQEVFRSKSGLILRIW